MYLIYLSGKYSGDIGDNIEAARRVAIELWEKGYSVITPHLNSSFGADCVCTYDDYIKGDLVMVSRCDAVVMLPGYEDSKGAVIEKVYAESKGIPVYLYPDLPSGSTVLDRAARAVNGPRQKEYAHPRVDFGRAARIVNAVFGESLSKPIEPKDIPMLMICIKLSRLLETPGHTDSLVDIAGYARTIEMLYEDSND